MKLNVGCGLNKQDGYLNLDKHPGCDPDQVMDAEAFPWPFADSSIDEVRFNHSLEHMGAQADVFLRLMQEVYRVCRPGAIVQINVPHPRHDDFLNDPTHVRPITPDMLCLFSKRQNRLWQANGAANSPLALYLDVDFEILKTDAILDPRYDGPFSRGQLTPDQLAHLERSQNNVVQGFAITLNVVKP